jgi:hypothetical protein
MSEKMYARLLRLYPSAFRKAYEGQALQLICDRLRDERGFFKRARLCWDLATDFLLGLPQAYGNSYAATEATPLPANAKSIPSFKTLDWAPLRPASILAAGTLSLAATAAFGFLLSRPMAYLPLPGSNERMSPIEAVLQRLNQAMDPASAVGHREDSSTAASSAVSASQTRSTARPAANVPAPTTLAMRAESSINEGGAGQAVPLQIQNLNEYSVDRSMIHKGFEALPQPREQATRAVGTVLPNRVPDNPTLDSAERQRVLDRAIADLRQYYFDHGIAQKTADALLAHEKAGDYDAVTDDAVFADLLTRQIRDASGGMHFSMEYSRDKLPDGPPAQTPADLARFRKFLGANNCFFSRVEMLPHGVGYIKLDWFAEPSICRATAVAAMARLNDANAIIFDLRDCPGGAPDMVALMAGYLFDHPEYWYSPRSAPTQDSWTRSPVPGSQLANKPVYILTSGSTASGGEQFSYDLKMLKRATLVGETTRGAAHAGVFHRIDDHFGIGIPEVKPINPYGTTDWAGVGVAPDVKVKAAIALETAEKLAEARIGKQ